MKLNFPGRKGVKNKTPSVGAVWIFSGTTYTMYCMCKALGAHLWEICHCCNHFYQRSMLNRLVTGLGQNNTSRLLLVSVGFDSLLIKCYT